MKYVKHLFWIVLYGAFVLLAFVLGGTVFAQGFTEIWGWDYQTFIGQINDWRWIGYFGFRHPGLGIVASPLVVLQHIWSGAYLFVMPAVATATAWLIWRMAGWIGLVVWLLFPTTWLMAGIPESFPLAQLALVGSVCWQTRRHDAPEAAQTKRPPPLVILICFSALNGMITLTNGIKPIVAYVATCGDWKKVARIAGAAVLIVLGGVGFFAVRACVTGRDVGAGLEATLRWIPEARNLPREFYGFFIRPVGVVQSCFVYPAALFGLYRLIRARQHLSLFIYTSYFVVDVCIHCVIGWGMAEPWVFAPHWIWMLPLVISGREAKACIL
ncbi:MAG: DUF6080 domain-containing protein [Kiritimatiellia bacterium]